MLSNMLSAGIQTFTPDSKPALDKNPWDSNRE